MQYVAKELFYSRLIKFKKKRRVNILWMYLIISIFDYHFFLNNK